MYEAVDWLVEITLPLPQDERLGACGTQALAIASFNAVEGNDQNLDLRTSGAA